LLVYLKIPYGEELQVKLKMIELEALFAGPGFKQVRVRHHGNVARIDVGRDDRSKSWDGQRIFMKLSVR
jgi:uncharacterized protein